MMRAFIMVNRRIVHDLWLFINCHAVVFKIGWSFLIVSYRLIMYYFSNFLILIVKVTKRLVWTVDGGKHCMFMEIKRLYIMLLIEGVVKNFSQIMVTLMMLIFC